MDSNTPIEPLALLGRVDSPGPIVVDVSVRGEHVGQLRLTLAQWDQLRDDVKRMDQRSWLLAEAQSAWRGAQR